YASAIPEAEDGGSAPLGGATTSSPTADPVMPAITTMCHAIFPNVLPSGSDLCLSESSVRARCTLRLMALSLLQSSTNSATVLYMSRSYYAVDTNATLSSAGYRGGLKHPFIAAILA